MKLGLLFLGVCFVLVSCTRKGCTDSQATNYDYKAKISDESCFYEAPVFDAKTINLGCHPSLSSCSMSELVLSDIPGVEIDYHVTEMIEVSGIFTINPGVTITFAHEAGFICKGHTIFNGTVNNPIELRPLTNNWGGLTFNGTNQQATINYVNLTGLGTVTPYPTNHNYYWAIRVFAEQNSNINFDNMNISDFPAAMFLSYRSSNSAPSINMGAVNIMNCERSILLHHYAYTNQLSNMTFSNIDYDYLTLPLNSEESNDPIHFSKCASPFYISTEGLTTGYKNFGNTSWTIDAGTHILMGEFTEINIDGDFISSGVLGDSVLIEGESGNNWKGFFLKKEVSNTINFNYTTIKNSVSSGRGMEITDWSGNGTSYFTNSVLDAGTSCGIFTGPGAVIDTTNSTFTATSPICL